MTGAIFILPAMVTAMCILLMNEYFKLKTKYHLTLMERAEQLRSKNDK